MSNVVHGVGSTGYSAIVYSAATTLVKGTLIVGVAGAAIAGIGYGLEKTGQKLADVARARYNQPLETIGNGCEWFGRKVHLGGKYTFLAVTVPFYAAGKWTIQVALPRLGRLVDDYVVTPAYNAIRNYGPRVIHEIGRGLNWTNEHVLQPINEHIVTPTIDFIRRHSAGLIRQIGRGFNWAVENALEPFYRRIVVPVARYLTDAVFYALRKIGDFGRYLGRYVFPILDRMLQTVERAAQWVFDNAIRPLYTQVLTPIGHVIEQVAGTVLYPALNAIAATARQIGMVIDQAFNQVRAQAARVFG